MIDHSSPNVLTSFKWEIKESFEELEKQLFKIYRLPHDFISVDQRSRIDTSAQFDDYLKECLNNFENPPYLCQCSYCPIIINRIYVLGPLVCPSRPNWSRGDLAQLLGAKLVAPIT
jgi:hypothetical protein